MIIRIMGEGQYRVDSCLLDDLNKIDNKIVEHVSKGDQKKFKKDLVQMISTIKEKGEPLDPVEILPSDIIVPPEDLTFDEARRVFSGHGLIED
ncbi:MAG TPA: hypothetical protein VLB04_05945 [Methanotrichaceae archaeon]|nr:hypothetical protein [Methanotrichaceae archaeon]